MTIKAICPDCGCMGDLIVFIPDSEARQSIAAALKIMPELETLVLRYLGMFRPKQRAMTMSKTVALLGQLANDMKAGRIERNGRMWVAPLGHWRDALEVMVDHRLNGKLDLPLKTHGYLYEILANKANTSEAKKEAKVEQDRQHGGHRKTTPNAERKRTDPQKASEYLSKAMQINNGVAHSPETDE